LDGPRNEDGQEVAEKVDGLEQGVKGLRVGLNQGSDYVKIDRFGTLSTKKRVQNATFHGQAGLGSMAQTCLGQDAIDPD